MKTALVVIGAIVLVACAFGYYSSHQSLASTKEMLQDTKDVLQETQAQLQETRAQLQDVTDSLGETRQELDVQKTQTDKYVQLYDSALQELGELSDELDAVNNKYSGLQQANQNLEKTIDDLQRQLDVYKNTLGIQVFSGVLPPYNTGYLEDLALINNPNAKDCTWQELVDFLREDDTDKNKYVDGVYMCGSYAQDLHNNAEARGIRAAFVAVQFYEGIGHAINAFKTLDRGLVYIDVTGSSEPSQVEHHDKEVKVERDKKYRPKLIFPHPFMIIIPNESMIKGIEIYW